VAPDRETDLIALLGEDLPGAVVVRVHRDGVTDVKEELVAPETGETSDDGPLRFSLAGAQLKFSVLYRSGGRGPTLAVDGRGGNWIAKLPSETYEEVPENEYAMINWAGRVGIDVPETALVKVGDIEGLPVRLARDRSVFLSRRFDRPATGVRIHQEDFAQVTNVRHSKRYGGLSYASIARIVRSVAGEDYFDEVVRRTAFNVLIGNGDAHLKNWSLSYPDGIQATLSPAYDLVATTTYIPDDKLALRLSRENRFDAIGLAHFERLGEKVDVPPDRVTRIVRDTIQKAMAMWPDGLSKRHSALLRAHVERLRLLKEIE
jgi:serine/threonine-protein kinase HipA